MLLNNKTKFKNMETPQEPLFNSPVLKKMGYINIMATKDRTKTKFEAIIYDSDGLELKKMWPSFTNWSGHEELHKRMDILHDPNTGLEKYQISVDSAKWVSTYIAGLYEKPVYLYLDGQYRHDLSGLAGNER